MELRIPGVTIAWDTGGQGQGAVCAVCWFLCTWTWVCVEVRIPGAIIGLRRHRKACPSRAAPPGKAVPPTKDNEIGYVALFGYRGNQVKAAQPRLLVSVPLVCRALRPPAGLGALMSTAPLAADAQLKRECCWVLPCCAGSQDGHHQERGHHRSDRCAPVRLWCAGANGVWAAGTLQEAAARAAGQATPHGLHQSPHCQTCTSSLCCSLVTRIKPACRPNRLVCPLLRRRAQVPRNLAEPGEGRLLCSQRGHGTAKPRAFTMYC